MRFFCWHPDERKERHDRTDAVIAHAKEVKKRSEDVRARILGVTVSYRQMDERLCPK
jgi:hypothetical protein